MLRLCLRSRFERNAWECLEDAQTSGEDFFAGSEAPTMSKPLDARMGRNLALMVSQLLTAPGGSCGVPRQLRTPTLTLSLDPTAAPHTAPCMAHPCMTRPCSSPAPPSQRSHVSTTAKPHAKHQLWLASLLAGPMKHEGGVQAKKDGARSRAWGRVLSDMLADAAFEANGKPAGGPIEGPTIARAEEAWQAFHLVVSLAYIPVDPADTGSAKANQVGTARGILADMVLRGSGMSCSWAAALMRANSSGLRDSIAILVGAVMPSSGKYREGLLDKVAQPLLSEV